MERRTTQSEELKFSRYFEEKGRIGRVVLWKREFSLHEPYSMLKRDFYEPQENGVFKKKKVIGRIDLMFRYRSCLFAGEIKWYRPSSHEFWDAMKIVAYTAYYNWENELLEGFDRARPAVLIPEHSIKLEHKIVANKLKVLILGIERTEKGYSLVESLWPF